MITLNKFTMMNIYDELVALYSWHPLTKYVADVVVNFNWSECDSKPNTGDFIEMLDWVCDNIKDNESAEELREIFRPLNVNSYNGLFLFRYKNYLELSDLGYNFSDFFYIHDGLYRECRSVVFDENGDLILAAIPKFMNYGEDDKKWSKSFLDYLYSSSDHYFITDKMDGSYMQFTYDKVSNSIIGSSSKNLCPSDNDAGWRLKAGYEMLNEDYQEMLKEYPNYTFCFEFIHPKNPIVVNYKESDKGLYLFAARNKMTGKECGFDVIKAIAEEYDVKCVKDYEKESLNSILNQLDDFNSDEKEGWVIHCFKGNNYNLRFKIKINDYVLMHKALSKNISTNVIIKAIADNRWDDFYSKIPEAYRDYADELYKTILGYRKNISEAIIKYFYTKAPSNVTRKELGIWVSKNVPKILQKYVFMIINNQPVNILKKQINGYKKLDELREESDKVLAFMN